jgi:hypothetical protein
VKQGIQEIISALNSYTEVSPSGTGIRIFCKGIPRPFGSKRRREDWGLEIYDNFSPRYLTVTGHHIDNTPNSVEYRQDELEQLYTKAWTEKPKTPITTSCNSVECDQVVSLAKSASNGEKFSKLYSGDWDGYTSQSQADLALCSLIAFYTGADPVKINEVFMGSGLYRSKWNRDDYRDSTIAKALEGMTEFYTPSKPSNISKELEALQLVGYDAGVSDFDDKPIPSTPSTPSTPVKTTKKHFTYSIEDVMNFKDIKWLVDKHIALGSVNALCGQTGIAKTFFALELALSCATGKKFLGKWTTKPMPVLYVAAEGKGGFKKRLTAWLKHNNKQPPKNFRCVFDAYNLLETSDTTSLLTTIREEFPSQPVLVVIDTLSRNFGGGDENSSKDMGAFINNVHAIKDQVPDSTFIIIHHTGKDEGKGARGHSAFLGNIDSMITLSGLNILSAVKVVNSKQKEDEPFPCYSIKGIKVELGDGNSLVLDITEGIEDSWTCLVKGIVGQMSFEDIEADSPYGGQSLRNQLSKACKKGVLQKVQKLYSQTPMTQLKLSTGQHLKEV